MLHVGKRVSVDEMLKDRFGPRAGPMVMVTNLHIRQGSLCKSLLFIRQ